MGRITHSGDRPRIQVCGLDYRPGSYGLDPVKQSYDKMIEVHKILEGKGLRTLIYQTEYGHIGPQL